MSTYAKIFALFLSQSEKSSNPTELILPFVLMLWSFAIIFFFCEFGEKVNNQFERFNDELCQLNWYLYPNNIQRLLLIFTTGVQQPVYLCGYGNIVCTRDSFEKVIFNSRNLFLTSQINKTNQLHFCSLTDSSQWIFLFYDASTTLWIEMLAKHHFCCLKKS